MNAAWRQILVAIAVIVTLIALGVLEVVTARLPIDHSFTAAVNAGPEPPGPWREFLVDSSTAAAPVR